MKSVRIFYTKSGRMKFISHLDMTRFMSKIIKRAKLPIWHTEGFHPHPYMTFALPLPLGFESDYEIMDIRLTDDNFPLEEVVSRLNGAFPEYVKAFTAAEPVMKVGSIAYAEFLIDFNDGGALKDSLLNFLCRESIICSKKTKKGTVKEIDAAPKIKSKHITEEGNTKLFITLPAGGEDNLNPELILNVFFEQYADEYCSYSIKRKMIYNSDMEKFK